MEIMGDDVLHPANDLARGPVYPAGDDRCTEAREAPTVSQYAWESAVEFFCKQAAVAPEHAAEIRRRMTAGATKPESRPAAEIDFYQAQIEEALDGFAYACGDILRHGKTPARLEVLASWADLLALLDHNKP